MGQEGASRGQAGGLDDLIDWRGLGQLDQSDVVDDEKRVPFFMDNDLLSGNGNRTFFICRLQAVFAQINPVCP